MHAQRISQCVLAALITAATAVPTVHLAGDSTMVATGGGEGTQGWGLYLPEFITLNVINYAAGGRSARSFTRERRFAAMAANVKPGDFVVAEFSHNDAESLDPANDGGRAPCDPGKTNNYAAVCHSFFKSVSLLFPSHVNNTTELIY
jgi:rhamnogalacturonan acetylesterase